MTKGSSSLAKFNLNPLGLKQGTSFPCDKGRINAPLLFLEKITEAASQTESIYQVPSYTLKWIKRESILSQEGALEKERQRLRWLGGSQQHHQVCRLLSADGMIPAALLFLPGAAPGTVGKKEPPASNSQSW